MSSPASCYVIQFDLKLAEKLKTGLAEQGFALDVPLHTLFQGKKSGVTCTLYSSGKLMVQGKGMKEFIEYYLEPEILQKFSYGYENQDIDLSPHIGVDESGKGDFFGPLCIAGVYAAGDEIKNLATLGVKDSKKLSDATILKIAEKIRKHYPHQIVKINPEKYNELYSKFGNLNHLLGWGHATVIEQLVEKTGCDFVIIDQFAAEHVVQNALKRKNREVMLTQRTRAEEDLVVAAASILARATFLYGMKELSEKVGLELPKGASAQTLQTGVNLVKKLGPEVLKSVGKIHFKTYLDILARVAQ